MQETPLRLTEEESVVELPQPPASHRINRQKTLGDYTADKRLIYLSALGIFAGAISALVAFCLVWLINVITNLAFYHRFSSSFLSPAAHHLGYFMLIVPVVGGLIVGLMARYGTEKIRGHGIPEALEAILMNNSKLDAKVAALKPLSSAVAIGTGGPFGAEGPIIMTGGAFGSLFAQLFHLSPAERKALLVAGASGGMAAIFSAPVAATILAVELLLFEWKPKSFIPVACASITAALLRVPLLGPGPLFPIPVHPALGWKFHLTAVGIGLIGGFASWLITNMVYKCEDLFHKIPIHWMWWPAIGGLFVGLGGLIEPRALGVGYDVIHDLLLGNFSMDVLLGLLLIKTVIWSLALSSGTSGGVLAPLLIMGGALGALESRIFHLGDPGLWAMVSMASVLSGSMGVPFTAAIFMLELTHDLSPLAGLLAASISAAGVSVLLLPRSILTEKLARRGRHVMREYSVNPLSLLRVEDVMKVPSPEDIKNFSTSEPALYPHDLLEHALNVLIKEATQKLPVVSPDDESKPIGVLDLETLLRAWTSHLDTEKTGEAGWLGQTRALFQNKMSRFRPKAKS